jgi:hypothetical protein
VRSIRVLILLVLGAATVACATSGTRPGALDSGVQGVIAVGPSCPVQPATLPCPDQPLADVDLTVIRQGSTTVVGGARSDAKGRFRIPLAPGAYVLNRAEPSNGAVPASARARPFLIYAHTFTELRMTFDSGIR